MASPGQKQGSCYHSMAAFDRHKKCMHCHHKGLGDDYCVLKIERVCCNSLNSKQKLQFATHSCKSCKKKKAATSVSRPCFSESYWKVTSASAQKLAVDKKKHTPVKASSKKISKSATPYDDIRVLDSKCSERFS